MIIQKRSSSGIGSQNESLDIHDRIVEKIKLTVIYQNLSLIRVQLIPEILIRLTIVSFAWNDSNKNRILIWLGLIFLIHHPISFLITYHATKRPILKNQIKKWQMYSRLPLGTCILFCCYGYWTFALGLPKENLYFLMMIGIIFSQALSSAGDFKASCLNVIPIGVTMILAHLRRNEEVDLVLMFFTILATVVSLILAKRQNRLIYDALYNRFLSEMTTQRLRGKNEKISHEKQQIEQISLAKSRFFASASHDIRQPLCALSIFLFSLKNNLKHKELLPTFKKMDEAVESLMSLHEEVLNITKLESCEISIQRDDISAKSLFKRLENEFKAVAEDSNLMLRFKIHDLLINSDQKLLERILRNLIANAIKYNHRNKVLVTCRRLYQQQTAIISVFDTGMGIAAIDIPHIFDDFYQSSFSSGVTPRHLHGVGLGLGIVKRFAEKLNHPINIRSIENRGSVFMIEVPISVMKGELM